MRLPGKRRRNIDLQAPAMRLHDELDAAHSEIDRLRREHERLLARCDSLSSERDDAIRECDRAVRALHRATAGGGPEPLNDFPGYVVVPRWRPLDYPRIDVETDATDADISGMCCDLAVAWSAMGEREPFFTNVAHDKFKMENIGETKTELFQTGTETLSQIEAIAQRQGIDIRGYRDCFELGCGVGRLTAALAGVFGTVYGMDVSASHLRVARGILTNAQGRVELRKFDGLTSIDALPRFDLFVSFAVLQHNPPPLAAKLLDKILAKVRVGGAACFQCQTYQTGYRFNVAEYSQRSRRQEGVSWGWEMHCLPQPVIYETFRRNGFSLLEARENGAQVSGISQIFFALREGEECQFSGASSSGP
jgi:SAM-dependent methyltransferase